MDNPAEQGDSNPDLERSAKQSTWLVRVSVFNPYLVIVLCLMIAVIGVVVTPSPWHQGRIAVDILPAYETPAVQVLTLYPGMPPEFMDRTITNPIERWTDHTNGT